MKKRVVRHSPDPNVATVSALIGDPGRAAMLLALLDGRDLPASELAYRSGLSPTAASAHLAKLVHGGLLTVDPLGRHRFYRLANADVGHALEALATLAKPATIVALTQDIVARKMRLARSCYDHLAGRLGVGITESLIHRRAIAVDGERDFRVTRSGNAVFASFGVEVDAARLHRRHFARQCRDWTERRPHLAGSLGAAVRDCFIERGWVERNPMNRSLRITESGRTALERHFSLEC